VADSTDAALGIRRIRFANGVMLNIKHTALEADRILVRLSLDGGEMLETRDNPLAMDLASSVPAGAWAAIAWTSCRPCWPAMPWATPLAPMATCSRPAG
jgi:hypothetical protein